MHRITNLFAFILTDQAGNEGVLILHGLSNHAPAISNSEQTLEFHREDAEEIARRAGMKLSLVEYERKDGHED